MPRSENQKLKLLYIVDFLEKETDKDHCISTQEIIEKLASYDIKAERKSIYNDINTLIEFGYDIKKKKSKDLGGYYLDKRQFELAEIKLFVDIIQASKFITENKSKNLIKKLERFVSKYDSKSLNRQVFVMDRVKTNNEDIYLNVDNIYRCIQKNSQITFYYFDWDIKKEKVYRKDKKRYRVSPFYLVWSEENYYLIGYDEEGKKTKYYRVDKMTKILEGKELRTGHEQLKDIDLAKFFKKTFSMFSGEEEFVTLTFDKQLLNIMYDRFGLDIAVRKMDCDTINIRVPVVVSNQFFGWITGIGEKVKITGPKNVKEQYKMYLSTIISNYE